MKRFLSLILILAAVFALGACGQTEEAVPTEVAPKDFKVSGMTITLTNQFQKATSEGYTACYETDDVAVFILKETFSLQEGLEDLSLDTYAELVRDSSASKASTTIFKQNGLTCMEYSFFSEEHDQTYSYFITVYKSSDAFWLVQFACRKESYDTYKNSFLEWGKSVRFAS